MYEATAGCVHETGREDVRSQGELTDSRPAAIYKGFLDQDATDEKRCVDISISNCALRKLTWASPIQENVKLVCFVACIGVHGTCMRRRMSQNIARTPVAVVGS